MLSYPPLTRRRRVWRWGLLNLSIGTAIRQLFNVCFTVIEHLPSHFVDIVRRGGPHCTIEDFENHVVNVIVFESVELVRKYQ